MLSMIILSLSSFANTFYPTTILDNIASKYGKISNKHPVYDSEVYFI